MQKDQLNTTMQVISDKNLSDREWALIGTFHEMLADSEVAVRAASQTPSTILMDGLFVCEQWGDPFLVRRHYYWDKWPSRGEIAVGLIQPNQTLLDTTARYLAHELACEFPELTLKASHIYVEVNDSEAAGGFPWNLAPPMPDYMKVIGFDGGWGGSTFVRYTEGKQ